MQQAPHSAASVVAMVETTFTDAESAGSAIVKQKDSLIHESSECDDVSLRTVYLEEDASKGDAATVYLAEDSEVSISNSVVPRIVSVEERQQAIACLHRCREALDELHILLQNQNYCVAQAAIEAMKGAYFDDTLQPGFRATSWKKFQNTVGNERAADMQQKFLAIERQLSTVARRSPSFWGCDDIYRVIDVQPSIVGGDQPQLPRVHRIPKKFEAPSQDVTESQTYWFCCCK